MSVVLEDLCISRESIDLFPMIVTSHTVALASADSSLYQSAKAALLSLRWYPQTNDRYPGKMLQMGVSVPQC